MTLNEALAKQNFISKVLLKSGEDELNKALKVKVMAMRIALSKFRKQFDEDAQEAIKQLKPEGYDELAQIKERTEEQEAELKAMNDKINEEYNAFLIEKGQENVEFDKTLTDDEFSEIMEVNAGNDVNINGNEIQAADFLEILYSLFVA